MTQASVIGRGTVVQGNVQGDSNIEVHGRVEGDISVSGDVVLGAEAVVLGNINGARLTIAGTVQGDLRGNETLLVERGARIVGDLSSPRLGVAPGALIKGSVLTDGEAALTQTSRRGAVVQPLRAAAPPVKAPRTRPEPLKAPVLVLPEEDAEELDPLAALKAEAPSEPAPAPKRDRQAPPPVIPSLGKHAKAKKKRREG